MRVALGAQLFSVRVMKVIPFTSGRRYLGCMRHGIIGMGLALWASFAVGQEQRCYRITHRVQIRMVDGTRHAGKLLALTDSTILYLPLRTDHFIGPNELVQPVAVPLLHIQRMALDEVDAIKDGGKLGSLVGGLGGLVAGGLVIAEEGSFTTATVLLPLLGAGLGWLVGATIASLPETVVKHRHGGPWTAEERMLVHDRLPLRCDPAP